MTSNKRLYYVVFSLLFLTLLTRKKENKKRDTLSHGGLILEARSMFTEEVMSDEDYTKWIDSGGGLGDLPMHELGAIFFKRYGCNQCHSTRRKKPTTRALVFGCSLAILQASAHEILVCST